MKTFTFKNFVIQWEPTTGWVNTIFPDGTQSGYFVGKDDKFHGDLLGITPGEHAFLHELMHQWVAKIYRIGYCPIIYAAAHNNPMPLNADIMEWEITALTYFFMGVEMRHPHEWKAIGNIAGWCKVYKEREQFAILWNVKLFPHIFYKDYIF